MGGAPPPQHGAPPPPPPQKKKKPGERYTFHGPQKRRLTAEQFADAVASITGEWRLKTSTKPEPARYIVTAVHVSPEVVEHVDSGKVLAMARTDGKPLWTVHRFDDSVDYFAGEEPKG